MSRLNSFVRDPISFVGGPWRATADLVLGRVATILYRSSRSLRVTHIGGGLSFFLMCLENESQSSVEASLFNGMHPSFPNYMQPPQAQRFSSVEQGGCGAHQGRWAFANPLVQSHLARNTPVYIHPVASRC